LIQREAKDYLKGGLEIGICPYKLYQIRIFSPYYFMLHWLWEKNERSGLRASVHENRVTDMKFRVYQLATIALRRFDTTGQLKNTSNYPILIPADAPKGKNGAGKGPCTGEGLFN